ncbi:hypothetical protein SB359474_5055 [Shigella boydii 3594-74]|uniref:Uncharacterized protein n=2 Tax=Shigella TaxID=620 RepID=A0A6N3QQI8_SHIFL|nr:hypothetical protein SGF_00898 [Shigella flexneri CDC 796-83]EGI92263.1 hypothetical protein SB359474_5055 [Shigella boydii 3594-74]EIQ29262.1 hypothetical protein SB444474_4985 [Shigella boydii 4444-74]
MRLIKRARWKGEYLPGTGNVKREPVSGKMYRLQTPGKHLGEREIAG